MSSEKETAVHDLKVIEKFLYLILEKVSMLKDRLKDFAGQIAILAQMVRDSIFGDYKLKTTTLLKIIACLVYFLHPVDIIPDFLPGGYADDMAVVAALFASLGDQIRDYSRERNL